VPIDVANHEALREIGLRYYLPFELFVILVNAGIKDGDYYFLAARGKPSQERYFGFVKYCLISGSLATGDSAGSVSVAGVTSSSGVELISGGSIAYTLPTSLTIEAGNGGVEHSRASLPLASAF
jgi:hypothetical protein